MQKILPLILGAALVLGGCASGRHATKQKSKSYDKAISEEDRDPTWRDDPQRAGETVRYVQ